MGLIGESRSETIHPQVIGFCNALEANTVPEFEFHSTLNTIRQLGYSLLIHAEREGRFEMTLCYRDQTVRTFEVSKEISERARISRGWLFDLSFPSVIS